MLNEMKYVYTVYEEKSFSKAAKKLYVTQPALSHMVRKAEEEVGALIFDRSTIPLTVTQEGMYYIKSVEEILFIQRNLKAYFKDLNELNAGSLSIGGSSFFCSFVLAEIIGRFKNKYPNVTIDLREGNIKELKKELEEETLDLVMETALSSDDITIEKYLYNYETIILAVPSSYDINKRIQPYKLNYQDIVTERFLSDSISAVPLEVFKDVPFIMMKSGNDMYQRSTMMCKHVGFVPKTAILMDQVLTSYNIASSGVGAVFIRSNIIKFMPENQKLVYYKIGDPLATRKILIASKKGKYLTSAMREFLKMAGAKKIDKAEEKEKN
ncbi:MAG: LysR family transcriptional regulator [Lachnospiraceae bacterium]